MRETFDLAAAISLFFLAIMFAGAAVDSEPLAVLTVACLTGILLYAAARLAGLLK